MNNLYFMHSAPQPLTKSQTEVYEYIKSCCHEGQPPSYREIQEHLGYKAVGTVQDHVKALIKKGWLEKNGLKKNQRRSRSLTLTGAPPVKAKTIPIYGVIAAGPLRDNPQIELGHLPVAEDWLRGESFALRVTGTSMIDVGIYEGDFVVVSKKAAIRSGDIVVALYCGETTVKRYEKRKDGAYLLPENATMSPIKVEGPFELQGKVVGLQRKF